MSTVLSSLNKRLDRHFIACAAAAVVGAVADQSWAVVQYSGPQNISVIPSQAGWYLNFETGATSNNAASSPAGWDINVVSFRRASSTNPSYFFPYVLSYASG